MGVAKRPNSEDGQLVAAARAGDQGAFAALTWRESGFGSPSFGTVRCRITRANRMPAVASYVRRPGDAQFHFLALDVLAIEGGLIVEVVAFPLRGLCKAFNLPETL